MDSVSLRLEPIRRRSLADVARGGPEGEAATVRTAALSAGKVAEALDILPPARYASGSVESAV